MSRERPSVDSLGFNDVREVYDDEQGIPVTYACDYLTSVNVFPDEVVPAYYDLVYPCDVEQEEAASAVATALLSDAAVAWGILPKGLTCTEHTEVNNIWLMQVSSLPGNTFVDAFGCQDLIPGDGECCVVVEDRMTFSPSGDYDPIDLMAYMAQRLDSAELMTEAGLPYRTSYIGSEVEYEPEGGKDELPPALNDAQGPPQDVPDNNRNLTVVGGFVLGGLLATLVGLVLVLVKRRRRTEKAIEIESALSDSHEGHSSFQVAVMSDHQTNNSEIGPMSPMGSHSSSSPYHENSYGPSSSYTFDLGRSFKDEVMGTHNTHSRQQASHYGPTTIEVVPPYPMEETSDSEADSWAQTDGTVGSLEEHLDEITAEI